MSKQIELYQLFEKFRIQQQKSPDNVLEMFAISLANMTNQEKFRNVGTLTVCSNFLKSDVFLLTVYGDIWSKSFVASHSNILLCSSNYFNSTVKVLTQHAIASDSIPRGPPLQRTKKQSVPQFLFQYTQFISY